MIQRLVTSLVCIAAATVEIAAFSPTYSNAVQAVRTPSPIVLRDATTTTAEDTDDVVCFVTNDEEIVTEGEKPHVVCTTEPDDYAWFNGVDPNAMRPTHGEELDAESCVEGESYKGKPEWECD